jgi:hypothetical protein
MWDRIMNTVPTGLRNEFVESLFPTLKRGANNPCAYGAVYGRLPTLQRAMARLNASASF